MKPISEILHLQFKKKPKSFDRGGSLNQKPTEDVGIKRANNAHPQKSTKTNIVRCKKEKEICLKCKTLVIHMQLKKIKTA